ncbi:MAG TPA: toll/interleukin-1 receptor domain-containing protein [Actinospica sp.]|jgi:hypothetical protein|nr:toll/interleukin-1 receptor domain-containing protein [Actinospica sp.]
MARIFISFRKVDDRATRERIHHALVERYGDPEVFKSGETIQPGTDYIKALLTNARSCPLMLVLIGADWLSARDESGTRLLDRDHDWVRREIVTAQRAGNRILPVLLGDGTDLPRPDELPPDIAGLGSLQALRVEHSAVEEGLARLVSAVDRTLPSLAAGIPNAAAPRTAPTGPNVQAGDGVAIGGSVTGVVGGRDVDARGATVVGGDQHITNKRGGLAAAAASVGSSAATLAALRKPFDALANWANGNRTTAIAVAAVLTVGGIVTAVKIVAGPATSGGPAAASSPTGAVQPFPGRTAGDGNAASPSDSPSPSTAPDATMGSAVTLMDQAQVVDTWADGSELVLETESSVPQSGSASGSSLALTTYSLRTGQQLGTFTPEVLTTAPDHVFIGCIDTLIRTDTGTNVLVVEKTVTTAAQGLTAGSTAVQMSGLDPATGSVLWTAHIPGGAGQEENPDYCVRGSRLDPAITEDQKYMLETETVDPYSVNLDSGAITKAPGATGVLGNLLTAPVASQTDSGSYTSVSELDPGTAAAVGKITNHDLLLFFENDPEKLTTVGSVVLGDASGPGGFSLPSGASLWSSNNYSAWNGSIDRDPETGATFEEPGPNWEDPGTLTRFSPTTGATVWTVPNVAYCGSTNGHVYVVANRQLVTLDEKSGKQLTYDPNVTDCPTVLDGVLEEPFTTSDGTNQYRFDIG